MIVWVYRFSGGFEPIKTYSSPWISPTLATIQSLPKISPSLTKHSKYTFLSPSPRQSPTTNTSGNPSSLATAARSERSTTLPISLRGG